ncbi:SPW repeat domain-containing protein [Paractinoplanes rishiriensis]|uniref:SPW repeat-containing integral membrane domain-containing protein n=1 Tax=Paractinoplanes rishiriensis TaxID=1050105 RepID=A0A919K8A4_9ACTN|nr:SPW repeat protein [Actinoplanes rishiriensis]GIF01223.1 hypothetical protein Ari01nite_86870 [Actinoplanes rishiriensis]
MTGELRCPPGSVPRSALSGIVYRPSVLVAAAGLWLTAAGFVLDGGVASSWSKIISGVVMTTFAAVRTARPATTTPLSLINVGIGAWLITSPFVLGYHTAAGPAWHDVTLGTVVMMLAGVSWLSTGKPPPADVAGRRG